MSDDHVGFTRVVDRLSQPTRCACAGRNVAGFADFIENPACGIV
jgi:hypothetical protein